MTEGHTAPDGKNAGAARALYNVLTTASLPYLFLRATWNDRWRATLEERCLGGSWKALPEWTEGPVWVHGASMGELAGVQPVIEALRASRPHVPIHVTTTSMTGRTEAAERKLAQRPCLLPLDHPWFAARAVRKLKPRLVAIAETELWPGFLYALDDQHVPRVLFNGRISRYSFPRYRMMRRFVRPLLQGFAAILVQTPTDAERFLELGAPEDRLKVTGSTKYARSVPLAARDVGELRQRFGLGPEGIWFVAGSVRPGEEEMVVSAFAAARKTLPLLRMIIAPRHTERFDPVAEILRSAGVSFVRRSRGPAGPAQAILLDTVGELPLAYGLATVAFVGGTLVDIGGHNPMEPAALAVPILVGPHTDNVQDAVEELLSAGGLITVSSREELARKILEISDKPDLRQRMGAAAFKTWERNSTAIEHVMPVLERFM